MKQSEAKEFLPLIKAWSEGKTLQIVYDGIWRDVENRVEFVWEVGRYRIKPEPREFWISRDKETGHNPAVYTGPVETGSKLREVIHVREVVND